MPQYEYKVVPAPQKGQKAKGVRTHEGRFALALQELMNDLAEKGWEYQRAEMLPSLERSGITSTNTEWRHVMIFRRLRDNDAELFAPELLPAPENAMIQDGSAPDAQADPQADTVTSDAGPSAAPHDDAAEAETPGTTAVSDAAKLADTAEQHAVQNIGDNADHKVKSDD